MAMENMKLERNAFGQLVFTDAAGQRNIGPLEYRAAEYILREKIFDIGLQSIAALEGVLVHGPRGPSVVFLVMTTGEVWGRGSYMALLFDKDSAPMFYLEYGGWADVEAISACAGLKQWKFPWDGEEFFVSAFKRAEAAARNLLMQGGA